MYQTCCCSVLQCVAVCCSVLFVCHLRTILRRIDSKSIYGFNTKKSNVIFKCFYNSRLYSFASTHQWGLRTTLADFLIFCVEVLQLHFHNFSIVIIVINFQTFHVHTCIRYIGACVLISSYLYTYMHASIYTRTHTRRL